MRHIKLDGMLLGVPIGRAEKYLKDKKVGSRVRISAWNGSTVFEKKSNGVEVVK